MSSSPLDRALSVVSTLDQARDRDTLMAAVSGTIAPLGFKYFVFNDFPEPGKFSEAIFCRKMPEEWLEVYAANRFDLVDPALRFSRRSTKPFNWADAPCNLEEEPEAAPLLRGIRDFGLAEALVVPIHNATGPSGIVWFGGTVPEPGSGTSALLYLLAYHAFERLRDMSTAANKTVPSFTPRERDVLAWMAAGKTAFEIAGILNIAERTVNFHTQAICRKYSAHNRTHAVALAVRDGVVSL